MSRAELAAPDPCTEEGLAQEFNSLDAQREACRKTTPGRKQDAILDHSS